MQVPELAKGVLKQSSSNMALEYPPGLNVLNFEQKNRLFATLSTVFPISNIWQYRLAFSHPVTPRFFNNIITLPKTNITPEHRSSQKQINLPTTDFQGLH